MLEQPKILGQKDEKGNEVPVNLAEPISQTETQTDHTQETIKSDDELTQVKEVQSIKDEEALKTVREQLGIAGPKETETPKSTTAEKIKVEYDRELSKSMIRLSGEVQELEDSLKQNRFMPISFHAEDLRAVAVDESIDFQKSVQAIDDLYTSLRKDFMPRDERVRSSIEPVNFTRTIDSLDELKGVLVSMRGKIDKRPTTEIEPEAKKLSENLTRVINTTRRKMDEMGEAQSALRRYLNR